MTPAGTVITSLSSGLISHLRRRDRRARAGARTRCMDLFGWFRRPPPIREPDELADFIDEQAAFLVQKGIYDYARARSGPYSKSLLAEPNFHATRQQVALAGLSAWPRHGGRDGRGRAAARMPATTGARSSIRCARLVLRCVRPLSGAEADRERGLAAGARRACAPARSNRHPSAQTRDRHPGTICRDTISI